MTTNRPQDQKGKKNIISRQKNLNSDDTIADDGDIADDAYDGDDVEDADDCLQYIFIVSKYKDYTFDYDDMAE